MQELIDNPAVDRLNQLVVGGGDAEIAELPGGDERLLHDG